MNAVFNRFLPTIHIPLLQPQETQARSYCISACALGTLAIAISPISTPVTAALSLSAGWSLWSSGIIKASELDLPERIKNYIDPLYASTININATISFGLLFPLTLSPSYHIPKGDINKTPILMLNGYGSFGSAWNCLRTALEAEDVGPIYTMNVENFQSIESNAESVQKQIQKIKEQTNCKEIILLCHSKGGLVGSYYATALANEETDPKITKLITLGTPFKGTDMARWGLGEDATQMIPGSTFLCDLQERINKCTHIHFFNMAGKLDHLAPPKSAILEKGEPETYVIDNLGHKGLLFSARVAKKVSEWIKTNPSNNRHDINN